MCWDGVRVSQRMVGREIMKPTALAEMIVQWSQTLADSLPGAKR